MKCRVRNIAGEPLEAAVNVFVVILPEVSDTTVSGCAATAGRCRISPGSNRSSFIPLLRPVVGTSDGEGRPAPAQAIPRLPGWVRTLCRRVAATSRRIDESFAGAALGALIVMGVGIAAPTILPLIFGGE